LWGKKRIRLVYSFELPTLSSFVANIGPVFESINITLISFEDHNIAWLNWTINMPIRFSLYVEQSSHAAHNAMTQILLIKWTRKKTTN